jgi:hypothetical protein
MKRTVLAAAVLLAATLSVPPGCQQQPAATTPQEKSDAARFAEATARPVEVLQTRPSRPAATRPAATVAHVVLVWLKKPGDAAARRAIIDAGEALKTIPGVVDVRAGSPIPSTRPVVDSSYDVGVLVTFTDEQALQAYPTHPTHLKVLEEVLKPNADHYKVYDFSLSN